MNLRLQLFCEDVVLTQRTFSLLRNSKWIVLISEDGQGCMQTFYKVGGELGIFKKEGAQMQAKSGGEHWKTMLKK